MPIINYRGMYIPDNFLVLLQDNVYFVLKTKSDKSECNVKEYWIEALKCKVLKEKLIANTDCSGSTMGD